MKSVMSDRTVRIFRLLVLTNRDESERTNYLTESFLKFAFPE